MTTTAHFPTLIYYAPLAKKSARLPGGLREPRLRADLLSDAYKLRDNDDTGLKWCKKNYPAGYTSYASMCQLHRIFSTFMDLEKALDKHARAFARRLDMDISGGKLRMTDCWVNIMPKHATHSLHLHPLSVISGTYYVKTPRGCSRIRFEDPRLDRFMRAPNKRPDCRPENRQQAHYVADAGHVVLFESWLRHEVAPNQSDTERVSISFNYDFVPG